MRVALAGNWPPPNGGVSIHVAALARALARRGIDVSVLDIGEGAHRSALVRPARGACSYAAALARAAAESRIVHVHTTGANRKSWVVAFLGGRAHLPFGPRGVLTLHSGRAPAWLRAGTQRRRLAAAACAAYGRIVAVNEEIAAALAACGVAARKIEVVAPFSPSVVADPAPPPELAAFRAACAPLYAAAVAEGATYGADVLLPAFRAVRERNPRAGLVLFGPAADPAWRREEGVLALGEVAHPAALGVIASADVFVRPTRADGDAVSVREALAFGRAVVATRTGKRPEACLLVPMGDVGALAEAMERAARSPPRAPDRGDEPDPFDTLVSIYETLSARRPLPDGGRGSARAPTF